MDGFVIFSVLLMLSGAAAIGHTIKQENKNLRWFHFHILSSGAHGLMLFYMGLAVVFPPLRPFMFLIGALTAIPPLARYLVEVFDRTATK